MTQRLMGQPGGETRAGPEAFMKAEANNEDL
jgi:hypothetical protein